MRELREQVKVVGPRRAFLDFFRRRHVLQLLAFIALTAAAIASYQRSYDATQGVKRNTAKLAIVVKKNRDILVAQTQTRKASRAQFCRIFIRQHEEAIKRVEGTEKYLKSLTVEERKTTLNKAVLQGLPEARSQIRLTVPPKVCGN